MTSPLVSIVIPAYRPDWLDLAIASALAQTHTHFELLISDDSTGQEIESIVSKWKDSRLRYMKNPRRGEPSSNLFHLVAQSTGEYIKFLFDDDFLFPHSVASLLAACQQLDGKIAFHSRHVVDGHGRITSSPCIITGGDYAELTPEFFFSRMVSHCANLIGEPSNILVHARTLKQMSNPFGIDDRRMRFLADMALYVNFLACGHRMVGVAAFGSCFRQHGQQASKPNFPGFSAGVYEWDLLRRWSAQHGHLSETAYREGAPQLLQLYASWAQKFWELDGFVSLANADRNAGANFLNPTFNEALQLADTAIEIREFWQKSKSA